MHDVICVTNRVRTLFCSDYKHMTFFIFIRFVEKPTYAQIAEWRKILHRLSYFLKSVDYLLLEMLRRLVTTAAKQLLKFVETSFHAGYEEVDISARSHTWIFAFCFKWTLKGKISSTKVCLM